MSSSAPDLDFSELRSLPLLAGFTAKQLEAVVALLKPVSDGGPLFSQGDQAEAFYLLTAGMVTLEASDEESYELRPLAVIGELGALTGRARNCTATVAKDSTVWRVDTNSLLELFEASPDLGLGFQQNLMHIVAEKISRDQTRMQDMRHNIVATQKAMKLMRDLLLESEDTAFSGTLHDSIENQIRRNRRANYRVAPPASLVSTIRFDDGVSAQVVEISRTHLSFRSPAILPEAGTRVSAVLAMSGPEIPVGGVVLRIVNGRVDVQLDPMVEDYVAELEGYLTRVQMLDFLV